MEILFEVIFEIIVEGSYEVMKSKKAPLALRIICGIIFLGIFILIIGLIGFIAVTFLDDNNYIAASLFLVLDIAIVILTIKEIKKLIKKKGDYNGESK